MRVKLPRIARNLRGGWSAAGRAGSLASACHSVQSSGSASASCRDASGGTARSRRTPAQSCAKSAPWNAGHASSREHKRPRQAAAPQQRSVQRLVGNRKRGRRRRLVQNCRHVRHRRLVRNRHRQLRPARHRRLVQQPQRHSAPADATSPPRTPSGSSPRAASASRTSASGRPVPPRAASASGSSACGSPAPSRAASSQEPRPAQLRPTPAPQARPQPRPAASPRPAPKPKEEQRKEP